MSQSHRLSAGGRLIDRGAARHFSFDGKRYAGVKGDTLASALLANGVKLVGRSYKYHRPRGIISSGAEEPNALINLEAGDRLTPNQRATQIALYDGLEAQSQNRWPSLSWDVGALNGLAGRMFSAGFYYKTFIHPRAAWKHVFEPFIRSAAGLGRAPTDHDQSHYEHFYAFCDVLIAGGGIAGLQAARAAADSGARVMIVEQTDRWGGRALVDDAEIDGLAAADWVAAQVEALAALPNVTMRLTSSCAAAYDHGYALIDEAVSEETGAPLRRRLWRVRATQIIVASGAIERPIACRYNDTPGVMLASAVRDYVRLWGVSPGRKTVLFTDNDDAYRTALALDDAGSEVVAVLDSRRDPRGDLPNAVRARGIQVLSQTAVSKVVGGKTGVKAVEIAGIRASGRPAGQTRKLACDCVGLSGGWSPAAHLYSHSGGKLYWDDARAMYRPDPLNPPKGHDGAGFVRCAGSADGTLSTAETLQSAADAASAAAEACGLSAAASAPQVVEPAEEPMQPLWLSPSFGKGALADKHFIDFQHDVTVADIELAAREGYESVEHAKRYTTLGMATDQGKLSNVNGHAILADALNKTIPEVGTTTFRPPYTPLTMGSIAGRKANALFKPIRQSPAHDWLDANGADWEPVGDWRRPYRIKQGDETREQSVTREILAVRETVGLLDASTLGKILVQGPDAGKLLDLVYTNMMSNLKVGRCRYGLMCNDNGFIFDDGVVARMSDDSFLVHTTSGGSDRVHAWLEEWIQTEWFDFQVYTANVTEQWAQFAVAGPKAREVIERLQPSFETSAEGLKFFDWVEGDLAGIPVRVFRISFSGELSYEIAAPAGYGLALWEKLLEAGKEDGIEIYGTEALHVLRAEKGFIIVGDETDNTVTPQDLGMSWAVSKKKTDFIGKRAFTRPELARTGRKQLVGLLTEESQVVLPHGAYAVSDAGAPKPMPMIGQVTSSYYSPTLKRSIAMALIQDGLSRKGETIAFPVADGKVVKAKMVDPVFYDKEGERQDV